MSHDPRREEQAREIWLIAYEMAVRPVASKEAA